MSRPTGVSVIGWGSVVAGGFCVLAAAFGLAVSAAPGNPSLQRDPEAGWAFQHMALLCGIQAAVGVALVASGRGLLHLRAWGAQVIRVAAWALLAFAVIFTAYFGVEMYAASSAAPPGPSNRYMLALMAILTVINLGIWTAPLGLTLRYLSRSELKRLLT